MLFLQARTKATPRSDEMKTMKITLLIVVAILSMSTLVEAANWTRLGQSNRDAIYVDIASITNGPNGSKEAWTKNLNDTPDCKVVANKCMAESLGYQRYFSNKTYCILQTAFYFTDGSNTSGSYSCDTERIAPDTLNSLVWECLYQQ